MYTVPWKPMLKSSPTVRVAAAVESRPLNTVLKLPSVKLPDTLMAAVS